MVRLCVKGPDMFELWLVKHKNSQGFAKEVFPRKAVDSPHFAFEFSQCPCIEASPFVFDKLELGRTFDKGRSLLKWQIR